MAEFFNKKEEGLQIELTEHGKYMLSQGLLRPAYYCFYDDEILYDRRAAPGGGDDSTPAEDQNKVDRRIRYETPNLKVSPNIISAETRQAEFQSMLPVTTENPVYFSPTVSHTSIAPAYNSLIQQNFVAKYNLAADPLGTSALNSQYDAAWHLNVLPENRAEITSTATYESINLTCSHDGGTGFVKEIPQLNVTIDYETFYLQGDDFSIQAIDNIHLTDNAVYLAMKKNYLLLSIEEKNTENQVRNFDIEVYHVSSSNAPAPDPQNQLSQKIFVNSNPYGGGGPPTNIEVTTDHVENYMNIYVDDEIPIEALNEIKTRPDFFAAAKYQGGNMRLTRNLYTTTDEDPCE